MSAKKSQIINQYFYTSSETSEEVIDVDYIIENKPYVETVRDFMRANICSIINEDDEMFKNKNV